MIVHRFPQYSPAWWDARRGIPTASSFDRIITPVKAQLSKGAEGYIAELIGELYDPMYGQTDDYVSAAMKNGTIMEPRVRAWYEFERDTPVEQVGFITTDDKFVGCSPDGLLPGGGLECKSPLPKTQVAYLLAGNMLPDEYRCQVHGCMAVTGCDWWDFVSYCDGLPPLLVRVERDEFTAKLAAALAEFVEWLAEARAKIEAMQPLPVAADAEPIEDEIMM